MTGSPRLEARNVHVRFEGVRALEQVDLRLEPGEILGLIGPNGAGKTTMVNVLTGFQRPTEGSVSLGGRDITGWAPHRRARAGLVRTFQGTRLFPQLSVRENLEVAALAVGRSPRTSADVATRVMRTMDLARQAALPAGSLPYGDERRVAIARTLACDPQFMFLDEPAAGLDEAETEALSETLVEIHRDLGCALLVIEHDVGFIMGLCHRVHVLDHGRTIAVGEPEQVRNDPEVLRAYLGDPEDDLARD